MPVFSGVKVVLTDIEGTTSSISFVHDVLFPYAAKHLPSYVREHQSELGALLSEVAEQGGLTDGDVEAAIDQLLAWIREDKKIASLKNLQGMIWEAGYRNGDYRAHVFPDVASRLENWKSQGLKLYVYSSGSVLAQKLFFEFSEAGNLLPLFSGYFDTAVGGKRESASYLSIVNQVGVEPDTVLFLSDVVEELEAASETGLQVCLLERPGNKSVGQHSFPSAFTFADIELC